METTNDLVNCLDKDLCLHIMGLFGPIDVIRAAFVSKTWRHFVIANGVCKKIFLKRFPGIAHIAYEVEGTGQIIRLSDVSTVDAADWVDLERDHRIYSSLLRPLATPMDLPMNCLLYPIGASSTHSTAENILYTMSTVNQFPDGYLFWSSKGQVDPDVPEHISYKLRSNVCIVNVVSIRPLFKEPGSQIYSPTSLRFSFGYSRGKEIKLCPLDCPSFDDYNWTYTSPEFPMTQEAGQQQFKLPEPIVCVGGVLHIEMLGRAQMDPDDSLFYIRCGEVPTPSNAYMLNVVKNGDLQLTFFPRILNRVLLNFRHDPNEIALMSLLWGVKLMWMQGEESLCALIPNMAQIEEDFRLPQMKKMTNDLVDCFDVDLSLRIMGLLNDPIDVIRAAVVSKTWRRFVIANGLCKKIFLKRFPHIAHIAYEVEGIDQIIRLSDVSTVDAADWADLERDHKIYSSLLQPLATPMIFPMNCLNFPIGASSTHSNVENILHTMTPIDKFLDNQSFWSSDGQVNPDVPEHIIYELRSNMCIVNEVSIRPFVEDPGNPGNPIYSPTSVRFRFGYARGKEIKCTPFECPSFVEYNWTYTSPEFLMSQEAGLQQFKLPEPIVCVGGVLVIEMLGRAQKDPNDDFLGYVEVLGLSLRPAYKLEVMDNGELQLKFYHRDLDRVLRTFHHNPRAEVTRVFQHLPLKCKRIV
ncbi:hypothetical protein ACS0TY_019926 [Phlomoides rotata]